MEFKHWQVMTRRLCKSQSNGMRA